MRSELLVSFGVALVAAFALTPVARRVALVVGLVDRPAGWKTHGYPTPLLGGAAVLAATILGSLMAPDLDTVVLLLVPTVLLALVGVLDDAVHLGVVWRLMAELAAGFLLWALDLGWQLHTSAGINLVLTCLWIVVVVNAFNIIDLMDTVAVGMFVSCACGIALLAGLDGVTTIAVMSLAVAGAALGFLPFNITPPRIFLGDGGTMGIGFLVGALVMGALDGAGTNSGVILAAPLLFAVPLGDAIWRSFKRIRAGIPLMTAGHDSIANALQCTFYTPSRVGLFLGGVQMLCSVVAVVSIRGGPAVAAAVAAIAAGAGLLVAGTAFGWRPRIRAASLTRE